MYTSAIVLPWEFIKKNPNKHNTTLSPTSKSNCHLQNACFHFFLLGSVFLLMVVVKAERF